jgi:ATP-dependent Lon protease
MPADQVQQSQLPLLPLDVGVIVPGMVVNLGVETDEAHAAIDAASRVDGQLVLVPRLEGRYASIGTAAQLEQMDQRDDGQRAAVVRGLSRVRIGAGVASEHPGLWVSIEPAEETGADAEETDELAREYRAVVESILERRGAGQRMVATLTGITEPGALADTSVYSPELSLQQKVELLETLDVTARLRKALSWARESLADASVKQEIESEVTENMQASQREYLLRQQMEQIKRELGDSDGDDPGAAYRAKLDEIDAAGDGVPDEVRNAVEKEINRLERTSEQSPEHSWIQTWLDWMTGLPWGIRSTDDHDLDAARQVLDADHTGLEEIKQRIVEALAVRKLRAERGMDETAESGRGQGTILTLVGPPGVGKTSLGESVARALGREFVRIALGGVRDEAEIRGFRRTYVGSQPGRIARALNDAGTKNPVVLIDEIDKVGADVRGDPSAALLEVLDPAQNHTFNDHYLEVDLDLSDVIFIATGNVEETIPPALLDRMEVIHLDGYTEPEKAGIAREHLLGRALEGNGLRGDELTLTDEALERLIADYTREAGVRGLQRELDKVVRKTATSVAAGTGETPVTIDTDALRESLGKRRYWRESAEETTVPGVATGLAVTGVGGDVLFVEATASDGEPGLQLTGQLGDVMQESASIALSYLRSRAGELGLAETGFERRFHVHVPAGATPKDGPSAGLAMTTALASLLSDRPVRSGVGMTGEVTLQGKVLPVGGIKSKALAAHRAGLSEVVVPAHNEPDLDDIPDDVRADLTFHLVSTGAQLLDLVLTPATGADEADGPGEDDRDAGEALAA